MVNYQSAAKFGVLCNCCSVYTYSVSMGSLRGPGTLVCVPGELTPVIQNIQELLTGLGLKVFR